jgi:murein DD-endopeptidase MepM/ murein hydrolase activator NlpD
MKVKVWIGAVRQAAPTLALLLCGGAAWAQTPQFAWPVACEIGRTCFIQQYVDHDPGPGARDYTCGTLVYDGHNGTDIRVPDLAEQRAGVDVLAAADGTVLRTRDDMADVSVATIGKASVEGRYCGNGMVIDHGGGWQTQYCHLARGSVRVKSGERVTAGQPLGRVGMSGAAEFPHVHFTVRHENAIVDPFAHKPDPATCGSGTSLWAETLRESLAYRARTVLNFGFAPAPVTMEEIEAGTAGRAPIGIEVPALVAFVRAIGLKVGDVQRLVVKAPGGQTFADNTAESLDRNKAQWMMFAGRKRPPAGWPAGEYRATYSVVQDGKVVLEQEFSATVEAGR